MTIDLKLLIEAVNALEMLRERADAAMSTDEYMQSLRVWSALKTQYDHIVESVAVEVKE